MKTLNLNTKIKSAGSKLIGLTALSTLLITGCITKPEKSSYNSDGQSAFMASELDQMGQVYSSSASGAAKTSASETVITTELVIDSLAYHDACMCFVRHAKFTTSEGYERDRVDSVTFLDSAGNTLTKINHDLIRKINHVRNVVRTKGGNEIDVHLVFSVEIKTDNGAKVGVWNGVMTGSYNDQAFKSGTITNVQRPWENGRFRFPTSGTIEIDRPVYHFMIDFLGNGHAKVTINNKRNNKVHTLDVDVNAHESEPVDQP